MVFKQYLSNMIIINNISLCLHVYIATQQQQQPINANYPQQQVAVQSGLESEKETINPVTFNIIFDIFYYRKTSCFSIVCAAFV
jgi:hypothetical protein